MKKSTAEYLAPLREKYFRGKNRGYKTCINAAVRAEIPGGNTLLDRLDAWHKIGERLGWGHTPEAIHETAYYHLLEIADEMRAAIRDLYGLPAEK